MINSNATRNEDRFYAILPSCGEIYQHVLKKNSHIIIKWVNKKDTILDWKITDMASVRLKLYEIMDYVRDKARILKACTRGGITIFPSFVARYTPLGNEIKELVYPALVHELYSDPLLLYILKKQWDKIDPSLDLSRYLLEQNDDIRYVFLPYFIYSIQEYMHVYPTLATGIYLFGNMKKNRWFSSGKIYHSEYRYCTNNYTFNIY
ncbi:unnamed protein product [Cunninghamella echinulata]